MNKETIIIDNGHVGIVPAVEPWMAAGKTPVIEPQPSFIYFVLNRHRRRLVWAIAIILLEFIGFKFMYPYANFIVDSHYYVDAAVRNMDINIWPVAYSKILRLFSVFIHSDLAVVTVQYLLLEAAMLYLYFTLLYFLHPGKAVSRLILGLFIINPAILSISNYILSDSIFTALTITWFTLSLWTFFRPRPIQVYLLAVLLVVLFMLRYYAIYYPVLTFAVILLSRLGWKVKVGGIGVSILLILGFIWHTSNQYEKLLGEREFSAFSGWQMASNALIMYRNLNDYTKDRPPVKLRPIHQFISHELDSINHIKNRPDSSVAFFYMWNDQSPLIRYMHLRYQKDSTTSYFKRWASMGSLFEEYGLFLIKEHPVEYAKSYVSLGVKWFAVPIDEALKTYNNGSDSVSQQIKDWFDYKSRRVTRVSKKIYTLDSYPVIMAVLNALMVLGILGYFMLACYKRVSPEFHKAVLLSMSYWVLNFLFSIVSAPMMLRYELSIMIFNIAFGLIIAEMIYNSDGLPAESISNEIDIS